jgi:hypothetical protein
LAGGVFFLPFCSVQALSLFDSVHNLYIDSLRLFVSILCGRAERLARVFGFFSDYLATRTHVFHGFLTFVLAGKACGTKLTLKTYTTKEGAIWCKSHVPADTPDQGLDVTTAGQLGSLALAFLFFSFFFRFLCPSQLPRRWCPCLFLFSLLVSLL